MFQAIESESEAVESIESNPYSVETELSLEFRVQSESSWVLIYREWVKSRFPNVKSDPGSQAIESRLYPDFHPVELKLIPEFQTVDIFEHQSPKL